MQKQALQAALNTGGKAVLFMPISLVSYICKEGRYSAPHAARFVEDDIPFAGAARLLVYLLDSKISLAVIPINLLGSHWAQQVLDLSQVKSQKMSFSWLDSLVSKSAFISGLARPCLLD